MLHRPGEHHSVWHFWTGPERTFQHWYLNLQTAFVRDTGGFDTQDLELDLIVHPDGSHQLKDDEVLDDRVAEGRYPSQLVDWTRAYGQELIGRLEREGSWWDQAWARWTPPPDWP
jgi:predicted RNA-binding protein associated with RNAse of E/G family